MNLKPASADGADNICRGMGPWEKVFDFVDKIFVTDVFHACEEPIEGVNSERFVKELQHKDKTYVGGDMQAVAEKIYPELKSGDLVITLGAGTVTQVGGILKKLSEKN